MDYWGAKGYVAPPPSQSQIMWGPDPPGAPLPTPMYGEAYTEKADVSPEPITQQLCCSDAT